MALWTISDAASGSRWMSGCSACVRTTSSRVFNGSLLASRVLRTAWRPVSRGMLSAGQALGLTGDNAPLAGIVGGLEEEALAALARLRPAPARIKEGMAV